MKLTKSSKFTRITIATLATAVLFGCVSIVAAQDDSAQLPIGSMMLPTASGIFQHGGVPSATDELAPVSTVYSSLAAGYAVTGSGFLEATGSWIVPTLVSCAITTPTYILTGMSNSNGTLAPTVGMAFECQNGKPVYVAYYIFYPYNNNLVAITTFTPKPGDKISNSVSYVGSGEYSVTIEDVTQGKTFSKVSPALSGTVTAAGWQVQVPAGYPIPYFMSIANGYDYTAAKDTDWGADSSVIGPIRDFGKSLQKIVRVNTSGVADMVPSALTTDGSSFKVVRKGS